MILNYFQSNNFGDALNPYIFNHFLPNFFDSDASKSFVGIGSILGLDHVREAKKKVVFSSGYAYGTPPIIDKSFDIFCVRGPLTCEILKINKSLAICDGAILLKYMENENVSKKYKFSFMPHWESFLKYDWRTICSLSDIQFIDPTDNIHAIIKLIKQSEVVIAEAMHAAIVADTLNVPWIPVKAYGGINNFKWQDWTKSLSMDYKPIKISPLYNNTDFTRRVVKEKSGYPFSINSLSPFMKAYEVYQHRFKIQKVANQFIDIKKSTTYLSKENLIKDKGEQLLEKLFEIQEKYGN